MFGNFCADLQCMRYFPYRNNSSASRKKKTNELEPRLRWNRNGELKKSWLIILRSRDCVQSLLCIGNKGTLSLEEKFADNLMKSGWKENSIVHFVDLYILSTTVRHNQHKFAVEFVEHRMWSVCFMWCRALILSQSKPRIFGFSCNRTLILL